MVILTAICVPGAHAARDFGTPILAEFGVEVNGEWFPWNGAYSGGGTTDGYGDPTTPDGPERFRDAYRHIIQICRDEGAQNITWVFHVNDGDWPQEEWNRFENYYPGDEWVDWLALSVYGAQTPDDEWWDALTPVMDEFYPRLAALTPEKPIIIAEFACTAGNPNVDQAQWAATLWTVSFPVAGRASSDFPGGTKHGKTMTILRTIPTCACRITRTWRLYSGNW